MNRFETNQCPLCGQVLQLRKVCGVTIFACPTQANNQTHYEVETDAKSCIQHMYVGEWGIDNFANSQRSRLYKQYQSSDGSKKWKLITEVGLLKADTEQNLLGRLDKLMLFL